MEFQSDGQADHYNNQSEQTPSVTREPISTPALDQAAIALMRKRPELERAKLNAQRRVNKLRENQ